MKFRLVYRGKIHATQSENRGKDSDNKVNLKHQMRQAFHLQIKELLESKRVPDIVKDAQPAELEFEACFQFVPMVWKQSTPDCSLHILFLRRDVPGGRLYAGDIDNRVKTLIDALRMPQSADELRNQCVAKGETPFYCLFEDDSLVNNLSVEMDRLLEPAKNGGKVSSEAQVVVTVTIEPGLLTKNGNLIF